MKKSVWMFVFALVGSVLMSNGVFAQDSKPTTPFKAGIKLYIDEMEGGLSGYLRAELMKKKVPVTLVGTADAADFIMTGESQERKSGWSEGWLTTKKDNSTGSVTVVSAATKEIVWADEAGDRSLLWGGLSRGGPRKVASRIADSLKDQLKK
jgi:hypothetical protein